MSRPGWIFIATGALVLGIGCSAHARAAGQGEQLAAQKGCAACHGARGEGNPQAGFPRLAGLPAAYLGWVVSLPLLVIVSLLTEHGPEENCNFG